MWYNSVDLFMCGAYLQLRDASRESSVGSPNSNQSGVSEVEADMHRVSLQLQQGTRELLQLRQQIQADIAETGGDSERMEHQEHADGAASAATPVSRGT